jgi:Plant transposon protein
MSAALRMMCYGEAADQLVEVFGMSESLIMECLPRYCDGIIESLGGMYTRETKAEEFTTTEAHFAELGFPGCIGSVDCASWEWDVCPVGWAGLFKGKEKRSV